MTSRGLGCPGQGHDLRRRRPARYRGAEPLLGSGPVVVPRVGGATPSRRVRPTTLADRDRTEAIGHGTGDERPVIDAE
ncbi:hypothetical protein Ae263Ps1_1328 [Pseudonocardia sp. Ae263_Ps1]|nr:hypothetical protein Ae150APs1_3994c [Pseudonocardia sp. Ae150A_Ps1]OLL84273.1 hypothetical protein Ae263Ps1_1328 [Pseudonocardia sp. Ae263_Ps1]OLL95708.1 hypothetical protein Ae356Ps1_5605c [Pseudonocardia sp. Ae356_Ps1]